MIVQGRKDIHTTAYQLTLDYEHVTKIYKKDPNAVREAVFDLRDWAHFKCPQVVFVHTEFLSLD